MRTGKIFHLNAIRFTGYRFLPPWFKRLYNSFLLTMRPEDKIIISSFPKSGSTYLRFLLYCYLKDTYPNYNQMEYFIPYAGRSRSSTKNEDSEFRKTHELPSRLYTKGIYIKRDPRAVAWSLYRSQVRRGATSKHFSDYLDLFLSGSVTSYSSWERHTLTWHSYIAKSKSWISIDYDELISDPENMLSHILRKFAFPVDRNRLIRAVAASSVKNVRKAEATSQTFSDLMAEGFSPIVGDGTRNTWEGQFSAEDLIRFDSRIKLYQSF